MRILIVYYSYSGTTRKLAEALAKALSADIVEIRCPHYRPGVVSFLAACYDSLTARLPAIDVAPVHASNYDLVIAGAPIWAGHAATPLRTYLREHRQDFKRMAFFVTYGGSTIRSAFAEMGQLVGVQPEATLALRTADVLGKGLTSAIASFVVPFRSKAAA